METLVKNGANINAQDANLWTVSAVELSLTVVVMVQANTNLGTHNFVHDAYMCSPYIMPPSLVMQKL